MAFINVTEQIKNSMYHNRNQRNSYIDDIKVVRYVEDLPQFANYGEVKLVDSEGCAYMYANGKWNRISEAYMISEDSEKCVTAEDILNRSLE